MAGKDSSVSLYLLRPFRTLEQVLRGHRRSNMPRHAKRATSSAGQRGGERHPAPRGRRHRLISQPPEDADETFLGP